MKYKELYCAIYYGHNDFGTIRYERMEPRKARKHERKIFSISLLVRDFRVFHGYKSELAMDKLTEQDSKSLDMANENLEALKAIFLAYDGFVSVLEKLTMPALLGNSDRGACAFCYKIPHIL